MLYKRKRISNKLGSVWIRIGFIKTKNCVNFCLNRYCHIPIFKNKYKLGLFQDICLYKLENTGFIVYVLKDNVHEFSQNDIINYYHVI